MSSAAGFALKGNIFPLLSMHPSVYRAYLCALAAQLRAGFPELQRWMRWVREGMGTSRLGQSQESPGTGLDEIPWNTDPG